MSLKPSIVIVCIWLSVAFTSFNPGIGNVIDNYNGIPVYYNGEDFTNVSGRNITDDGYNLGLKYQCVEFVKRYYYYKFDHKMPYTYGHAKDFFDATLEDRDYNVERGLLQFRNVRYEKPKVDDILVFGGNPRNPFGHIGIVSKVTNDEIVIVQQNIGQKTRQSYKLVVYNGIYTVADEDVLGWLRMAY